MFGTPQLLLSFEPAKISQYAKGNGNHDHRLSCVDGVGGQCESTHITRGPNVSSLRVWLPALQVMVDVTPSRWLTVALTPVAAWLLLVLRVSLARLGMSSAAERHLHEYLVAFVAAVVPGILMAHAIEIPFLALRNRLFPAQQQRGTESIPLRVDLAGVV